MATWYLSKNGSPKQTFDQLGLVKLQRKLVSQGSDTVTFDEEGANVDSAPQFDYEDLIVIYKNNTPWFLGIITKIPVSGSSSEESHTFEVSGPWWYFDTLMFQQSYVGFMENASQLNPPAAESWYAEDLWVNEGDDYVGTDDHNHAIPSILFHEMDAQSGGLLVRGVDGAIFGFAPTTHVFLNGWEYDDYGRIKPYTYVSNGITFTSGLVMNTGAQIVQVLEYVIKAQIALYGSARFQIGTISVSVPAMMNEQRDLVCSEVIKNQLRWSPDAVAWFDYSTSPPTFNIGKRSSMDATLLPSLGGNRPIKLTQNNNGDLQSSLIPITSGWAVSDVSITPRSDLQVPFVKIYYEQTNESMGKKYAFRTFDIYPTDAPAYGFGAMISTVDLQGGSTGAYADIVTATIPDMADGAHVTSGDAYNWWKERKEHPLLISDDVIIEGIVLNGRNTITSDSNGNALTASQVPRELISGQIAPWMAANSSREQVTATVNYHTKNGQQFQKDLSTTLQSTNLSTNTYMNQGEVTYAEPVPVGLAKILYDSVSAIQYDGQITISEDECSGIVGMGQVLNLSPSWEGMSAMIVQIDEDVDTGTTQVSFGPRKNLGVSDLVELVRVIRSRVITNRFSASYGGGGGSDVGLGTRGNVAQADHTSQIAQVLVASQVPDPLQLKTDDPENPAVIRLVIDSTSGQILMEGRDAYAPGPDVPAGQPGDGVIDIKLEDLITNDALNTP